MDQKESQPAETQRGNARIIRLRKERVPAL
jgi:hypothetical protein